jgi:hypothetical protein
MTKRIFGTSGTGVNEHTEIPPVIHVHNTEPFADYDAARNALQQKILHPGEIAVVYYTDPGVEDGISSVVATGPLYQGGHNQVFKNADEIDALADYLKSQMASQDEYIEQLTEQLKAAVNASVNEQIQQLMVDNRVMINNAVSEINEHVDASLDQIENRLRNEFIPMIDALDERETNDVEALSSGISAVMSESQAADTSIRKAIDASYAELVEMIGYQGSASDASIINYVDAQIGALRNRTIQADQMLHNEIVAGDSSLDARLDALEMAFDNEVTDRIADLDREIENLRLSQKNYTDNLRLDVSLGLREVSAGAVIYTDASVNRLRLEMKADDASLEERVNNYTDAELLDVKRAFSQTLAENKTEINEHIDASYGELIQKIESGDAEVYNAAAALTNEGDVSVYNALIDKTDADKTILENMIQNGVTAAKAYADSKDALLDASVKDAIEAEDVAVRNDLSTGLEDVLRISKEYTDASVSALKNKSEEDDAALEQRINEKFDASLNEVNTALNQKIDNTSAQISEHVDASYGELVQKITDGDNAVYNLAVDVIRDGDASVVNYVNETAAALQETLERYTDASVNTLRTETITNISTLEERIETHIDASVTEIRTEVSTLVSILNSSVKDDVSALINDINAFRTEIATNLNNAITTLDASVAENIAQNVSVLTEEYQAADAALEADVMAALGEEVQTIDASIAYNVSTLAGEFEDRIRGLYATITDEYTAEDASLKDYIDSKIDSVDASIEETIIDYNEKIQTLRSDVSDGEIELQEQINAVNERVADLSTSVAADIEQLSADVSAADEQLNARIDGVAEHLAELEDATGRAIDSLDASINDLSTNIYETVELEIGLVRQDVSALDAFNAEEHAAIRNEFAQEVVVINETIEELDASVSTAIDEVNEHIDASIQEIINESASADASIEERLDNIEQQIEDNYAELKGDVQEVHDELVDTSNALGNFIDQQIDAVNASIAELAVVTEQELAALRDYVDTEDASIVEHIDSSLAEFATEAVEALDIVREWNVEQDVRLTALETTDSSIISWVESEISRVESKEANDIENVYNYIDTSILAYVDENDFALSNEIADVSNKVDALVQYVETADAQLSNSINEVASDVSLAFVDIETINVDVQHNAENISLLDSSVKQLFDMMNKLCVRLGIDKIEEPSVDVLPDMMQKIQDLYDEELEWRILDSSAQYDPEWHDLSTGDASTNENNRNMVSQDNLRNLNDASSEEQTVVVQSTSSNGAFDRHWRSLGD